MCSVPFIPCSHSGDGAPSPTSHPNPNDSQTFPPWWSTVGLSFYTFGIPQWGLTCNVNLGGSNPSSNSDRYDTAPHVLWILGSLFLPPVLLIQWKLFSQSRSLSYTLSVFSDQEWLLSGLLPLAPKSDASLVKKSLEVYFKYYYIIICWGLRFSNICSLLII